jgi:hypothetical protein
LKLRGFIEGPKDKYGDTKIVNLDQVTNIHFSIEKDRQGDVRYKIIFNFSYPVSLRTNISKKIPDYTYFVYPSKEAYDKDVEFLSQQINQGLWLAPQVDGNINRIVNPNFISFIAVDKQKNRVIVNLATSVSFYNDFSRTTSDFIYFDFSSYEEFQNEYKYMKGFVLENVK